MKTKHVLDELSLYIDGQARDPDRIARHLQQCPECAQRHMDLLRLSAHLKGLQGPVGNPAFTERVLAAVRRKPEPNWARWPFQAAPWLAAATIVLVILAVAVVYEDNHAPGWANGLQNEAPDRALDEGALLATLEKQLEPGQDIAYVLPEPSMVVEELDEVPALAMVDVLAETPWFAQWAGSFEAQEDLNTVIQSLTEAESEAFSQVLQEYANEERIT